MVTLEQLVEWNHDYNLNFGVTDEEVKIANEHLKVIDFWQKNTKEPQVGDLVQGLEWGHVHAYEYGLIVKIERNVAEVCYYPYVPFVNTEYAKVSLSCSGGPFTHVHLSCFEPIEGMKERLFKDWGRMGVGADQAFDFPAEVHQWKLKEPISLNEIHWGDRAVLYEINGSEFFSRVEIPFPCHAGDIMRVQRKDGESITAESLGYTKATIEYLEAKEKGGKA